MLTAAGIAAGFLLVILIFSIVVASRNVHNQISSQVSGATQVVDLGDNIQKAEINAVEREVFGKADQVRNMADTKVVMMIAENERHIRKHEALRPYSAPSVAAHSEPSALERDALVDPMNETSFLKLIVNKVEHVKKLSQDF